jgi:hypothetical protein
MTPTFGLGDGCITLPSSDAAVTLVQGNIAPGIVGVAASTLLRAGLIAGGLYLVGQRDHLARNAIAAASAIEIFVLAWVAGKNAVQNGKNEPAAAPPKVGFP